MLSRPIAATRALPDGFAVDRRPSTVGSSPFRSSILGSSTFGSFPLRVVHPRVVAGPLTPGGPGPVVATIQPARPPGRYPIPPAIRSRTVAVFIGSPWVRVTLIVNVLQVLLVTTTLYFVAVGLWVWKIEDLIERSTRREAATEGR